MEFISPLEIEEIAHYKMSLKWARAVDIEDEQRVDWLLDHLEFQVIRQEITEGQREYIHNILINR